jgi:hypothetical protein
MVVGSSALFGSLGSTLNLDHYDSLHRCVDPITDDVSFSLDVRNWTTFRIGQDIVGFSKRICGNRVANIASFLRFRFPCAMMNSLASSS